MDPELSTVDVDPSTLNAVARAATGLADAEVLDWESERLEGGTVSDVLRLWGHVRAPGVAGIHPWSAILKILEPWDRPGDPDAALRERRMYESGLLADLPRSLRAPRYYHAQEMPPDKHWLWIEDVQGRSSGDLTPADYATIAYALGRAQGELSQRPQQLDADWLSKRGLLPELGRHWADLLEMARPDRVAAGLTGLLPRSVEDALCQSGVSRSALEKAYLGLPSTLCHRELYPGNVFVADGDDGPTVTLIDWDRAGRGSIGEDVADLVVGSLLDGYVSLDQGPGLRAAALRGYGRGLAEVNASLGEDLARRGYLICVALHWLPRVCVVAHRSRDEGELEHYVGLAIELASETMEAVRLVQPGGE